MQSALARLAIHVTVMWLITATTQAAWSSKSCIYMCHPTILSYALAIVIQVPRTADVLSSIACMSPERAAEAHRIVHEMEDEGRRTLRLMPGAVQVAR
jgi:ligand-binding sensor protein